MKKNKTLMDCPECGEIINTLIDDNCPYCGYDWIFDDGRLREPTNEELDEIENNPVDTSQVDEDIINLNNTSSRGER